MRRWFGNGKHYPAVILGEASGGLVCRDFDEEVVYERWASDFEELAGCLPTVRTARGRHVYFRSHWQGFMSFDDGELRGDSGHYCLVPPALHPSGARYEWLLGLPDGELPLIDAFSNGLAGETTSDVTEEDRSKQKAVVVDVVVGEKTLQRVREAIAQTQPSRQGERNRCVFEFARKLRGIPELAEFPAKQLMPFVEQWHREALPVIGTKPFVETRIDFLKGWPRVKWPANAEFMSMIHERAKEKPVEMYDDPKVNVLAGVCRELAQVGGNGFYLATRTVGRLLDVSHTTASRWLFLLEEDGVIETVEKGGTAANPRKATRFRYKGRRI